MFAAIRKLVIAVVGLALIVVNTKWGVDLTGMEPTLVNLVLGGLTAAGIYVAPNEPVA